MNPALRAAQQTSLPCYGQSAPELRELAWQLIEETVSLQTNVDIPIMRVYFIALLPDWYIT